MPFLTGTWARSARCGPVIVASAGCVLALAACSASSGTARQQPGPASTAPLHSLLPAAVAEKGKLIVGSDIEYPPFESYAADGKTVVGIDREVADGLGKELGVSLVFENSPFDALIPGLASKRYDMAMSAMTDTGPREEQVDFVDYLKAGGGIMLPAANPHHVKTPGDLCGLNVAIDKGTTEVEDAQVQSKKCVAAGKKPLNVAIYPGNNQMVLALQSGRADVAMIDSVSGSPIAQASKGALIALPPYNQSLFGIVFPKGATQLEKAVQQALTKMAADGSYQKIFVKYGLPNAPLDKFPINAGAASSR